MVLTLLLVVTSGYALSKKRFRAKRLLLNINQTALMFVPISVMIPRYLVVVNLGIDNTIFSHIIPMLATPVGLFLVKQFIDQIPDSILKQPNLTEQKIFIYQADYNSTGQTRPCHCGNSDLPGSMECN